MNFLIFRSFLDFFKNLFKTIFTKNKKCICVASSHGRTSPCRDACTRHVAKYVCVCAFTRVRKCAQVCAGVLTKKFCAVFEYT